MRNRYARNILCVMAVFCAAAMTGCGTKTVKDSDVVMEIAGQAVVKAEYQMILSGYQAEVKRQYDTDTANREDFWTNGQQGERPLDQIMQLARQDLTHRKVVAQLAKEHGVGIETDYLSVSAQAEEENASRGEAGADGEDVYGLTSFSVRQYYEYACTQAEYELAETLKNGQEVPEEELARIYEENKSDYTSDVGVKMLAAELAAESGMELAEQAAEEMKQETDLQKLAKRYPDIVFYEIEMSSLNMQEGKSGVYMQRWLTASSMQPGEVCEPFAVGEKLMVMRCLARTEQEAQPFEEVKGLLKDDVQSSRAYEEIEAREEEARAEPAVSREVLEQIALEALEG